MKHKDNLAFSWLFVIASIGGRFLPDKDKDIPPFATIVEAHDKGLQPFPQMWNYTTRTGNPFHKCGNIRRELAAFSTNVELRDKGLQAPPQMWEHTTRTCNLFHKCGST